MTRHTVLAALALTIMGCGVGGLDTLKRRASFDLQCPEQQVQLHELDGGKGVLDAGATYGVRGCGKQATYVKAPLTGTWVMNSAEPNREGEPASN